MKFIPLYEQVPFIKDCHNAGVQAPSCSAEAQATSDGRHMSDMRQVLSLHRLREHAQLPNTPLLGRLTVVACGCAQPAPQVLSGQALVVHYLIVI